MSPARQSVTDEAFAKLDSKNRGYLTKEDISSHFNFAAHPQFAPGQKNSQIILKEFLENFDSDADGLISKAVITIFFVDSYFNMLGILVVLWYC